MHNSGLLLLCVRWKQVEGTLWMRNLRVVGYQRGIRKSSRETMKVQASIGVATFLNSEYKTPRSADNYRFRKDGLGGMFVF